MIKFFRRIRQQLLGEGKTGKYFKYAIGEILLVMIGILLALQVNNWNEERKGSKIETKALQALQVEYTESLEKINELIKRKKNQEKQGRGYLEVISSDSATIEEKVAARAPGTHQGILGINNAVLNSLLNSGDFDKIKNDSLKVLLNGWFNYLEIYLNNELRYSKAADERNQFTRNKLYRSFPKQGDYSPEWPGGYFPNQLEAKNLTLEEEFMNSLEFYNLNANIIQQLYIQLMSLTVLKHKNTEILELIDKELRTMLLND